MFVEVLCVVEILCVFVDVFIVFMFVLGGFVHVCRSFVCLWRFLWFVEVYIVFGGFVCVCRDFVFVFKDFLLVCGGVVFL